VLGLARSVNAPPYSSRRRARVAAGVFGLATIVALALFLDLGRPDFWDPGESRYVETVREMAITGNWLDPTLNFVHYYDKPPGFFWLVGGAFKSHGLTKFTTIRVAGSHPSIQNVPSFESEDETYVHTKHNPVDRTVLEVRRDGAHDEPYTWVKPYGKGRVFHDTLGHVGATQKEPIVPMNSVDYIVLLQRGTEWAATGAVTIPVPRDFPAADKTSIR